MKKDNRLLWADNLRFAATVAVVILHVSVSVEDGFETIPLRAWLTSVVYDVAVRWCVPVFVMLTGSFALHNYDGNFKNFLIKTFQRIILPFLFWSLVYLFYYNGGDLFGDKINSAAKIHLLLTKFATGTAVHLWFVYMIIGMYLLIPILNRWVRLNNKAEQLFFLGLWVFFLFAKPLWDKYDISFDSSYFTGFIGYLILGNYLNNETRKVNSLLLLFIFLTALLYTCVRTYYISVSLHEMNETYMDNFMPNIVVMCGCIYLLFKNGCMKFPVKMGNIITNISRYSYGIYLVHLLVLDLMLKYGNTFTAIHPLFYIPLLSLCCLLVSFVIIYVFNKIRYLRIVAG
ncbi:MAG: acyltransferase family protein [Ferruginibacter sp.]|nr:acyltransferase family protein [Ferruginibacter sp.]